MGHESQTKAYPICQTEYRVSWHPTTVEHSDSQTCFCGYVLASWTGRQTARFDVVNKFGVAKLAKSKSHWPDSRSRDWR